MKYQVGTLREAGLEAKWSRTRNGAPIIVARDSEGYEQHQKVQWWAVDDAMWKDMERHGIRVGFDNHTMLGNFFSVPA